MARKFLLCFHDFSVWNYTKVTPVLEELKDLVGAPFSVLVIPDTEKATPEAVQGFRETLLRLKGEGFELALHGYKHKAEFSQGRSYMGLIGMNLTNGEAEFAGLSEYESDRLLQAGLAAWNELFGEQVEKPVAFIPPTWYSNNFLCKQVRKLGILFEDRFSITTMRGNRYASLVTGYPGFPDKAGLQVWRAYFENSRRTPANSSAPGRFPDQGMGGSRYLADGFGQWTETCALRRPLKRANKA